MISRTLKVSELLCRTRPGGGPSYYASVTIDEVGPITLRVDRDEYEAMAGAIASGARFTCTLRIAPPVLDTLASRDVAEGAA